MMDDVKMYLMPEGMGRPATRGKKVGDELMLPDRKATFYADRGWASRTRPSADIIDAAPAVLPPPARPARKVAKSKAASARRAAKPATKRKGAAKATAKAAAPAATSDQG